MFGGGGGGSKGGGKSKPVLIDLSGKGITVDTLQTSQTFFDFEGDGYQRRTAWAGTGTGVLVLDADGDGKISRSSEFAFTEWAEGAGSDLEALRRVFDTNNNNKLDAGDSRWAEFKIWLNGALVSLASQNIASIDLIASGSGQSFEDRSAITGTSTFTRTNGTTGTVGDAVLANEEESQIVKTAKVTNADGTSTTTITGFDKDGSTAFRNVVTASADGLSLRTQFDDDGDGIFDRSQTDVRSLTGGVQKRVVSNFNSDGSLKDTTTTTTSADLKTVTTDVDQDGDGTRDQSQVYQKNADSSTSTTVTQFSGDGTVLKRISTTGSADGLTKIVRTDADGDGHYEHARSDVTSTETNGVRRKTVEERGESGNMLRREVALTSANGLTTTVFNDGDGNGAYETRNITTLQIGANGAITTTSDLVQANLALLSRTTSVASKDGLSRTEQSDLDGNGTVDLTHSDVTVNSAGALTQTVTDKSGNGTLLGSTVTTTSADRKTIGIDEDSDGDGKLDTRTSILIDANGVTTSTKTETSASGAVLGKSSSVTSADGLTITTKTDQDGDGTFDETTVDTTYAITNGNGNRARIVTVTSADGTLIKKSATTTSADGLLEVRREDLDGNGSYDRVTTTTLALNADGSRLSTIATTSGDWTPLSKTEILTSTDRKTVTTTSDLDGDGKIDETTVSVTKADGSRVETTSRTATNGLLTGRSETAVSGNAMTTVVKTDLNGDGVYDTTTTTGVVFGSAGERITTVTTTPTGKPTETLSKSVTTLSGNKLKAEVLSDADGDGVFETKSVELTTLNADGSKTSTASITDSTGKLLVRKATTTSASGLSVTSQEDLDGNAAFERVITDTTTLNADGSKSKVVETRSSSGGLIAREQTVTKANGHDATVTRDLDGDGATDETATIVVNADGAITTVNKTFDASGKLTSQATTIVSGNGLTRTLTVDIDGDGITNRSTSDVTTLNANGSRTQVLSEFDNVGALWTRTTVETSANGLVRKTTWAGANGATKRSATESTVPNSAGGTTVTRSVLKADGSLESRIVETTAARANQSIVTRDVDGDGVIDGRIVTITLTDGTRSEVATDLGASNTVKDSRTVKTAANGLAQTTEWDSDGNGTIDKRVSAATVLNADGTRTTTTNTFVSGSTGLALKDKTVTDVSADGFSVSTKWDLNGDGTFEKSRTSDTVLNADGSKAETTSYFAASTLGSRYLTTTTGNGLSRTVKWDPTGSGTYAQTSTDVVNYNSNGDAVRTVTASKADGSVLSKTTATTSASGDIVTTTMEEVGQEGRTVTSTTDVLADGAVRQTALSRLSSSGALIEKAVTTTSANRTMVSIERDKNGDGVTDQTELQVKAFSGEETTTVTNLDGTGNLRDRVTTLRSADGRRTTTTFDRDGDWSSDRTKITDEIANVDGSRVITTTDADSWTNKPASKTVTRISADGFVTTTVRDIDGNGTVDQTETVTLDATGASTTVLTNSTAAALDVGTLPSGVVQWKPLVAETVTTVTSTDGLSTTRTFAYAENNAGTVTRTTAVMRETRQIDGSLVTDITETNASGSTVAKGRIVTSIDGRTTTLTKDSDANGTIDRKEKSVTAIDGTVVLTKTDFKADGTMAKVVTDIVNMAGNLVSSSTLDANGRKTEEIIVAKDGSSTNSKYDAAEADFWKSITNYYDKQGRNTSFYQLNDDGTYLVYNFDVAGIQQWGRTEASYDSSGRMLTKKVFYNNKTQEDFFFDPNGNITEKRIWSTDRTSISYLYDIDNAYTWSRKEAHLNSAGQPMTIWLDTEEQSPYLYIYNDDGSYEEIRRFNAYRNHLDPQYAFNYNKIKHDKYGYDTQESWSASTPVLLDLDNDSSVSFLSLNFGDDVIANSPRYDWNGDGVKDATAWVGPSDGMLVIDLDDDGDITASQEIAFTEWLDAEDASMGKSDLEALQLVFDTNHDDILSSLDDRWGEFRVWQDLNQNGVSEAGELKTMSEAGIDLINLVPSTDGAQTFSDGSAITGTSTYQTVDGRQHVVADATLAWRAAAGSQAPFGS